MLEHATMCRFADSEAPLRSRILVMTTPPRAVSIAAIAASVVLGVVLLVGVLEIPVPGLRIQVELGQPPPLPEAAAITPTFRPSSTRPVLLNEPEVRRVADLELARLTEPLEPQRLMVQVAGSTMAAVEELFVRVTSGNEIVGERLDDPEAAALERAPEPRVLPRRGTPTLANKAEVWQMLRREYTAVAQGARVSGSAVLWILVDRSGVVTETRVHESSGHAELDRVAQRVGDAMRFTFQGLPALTWVQVPIRFTADR
jgi:TonB family protein